MVNRKSANLQVKERSNQKVEESKFCLEFKNTLKKVWNEKIWRKQISHRALFYMRSVVFLIIFSQTCLSSYFATFFEFNHNNIQGASIKRVISEIWLGCLSRPIVPFITCLHALKEYQGMSGYYRKLFVVPIVHSIAPTSPNIEAIIIESYFANHPFFLGTL